ncbi:MAG: hypothetical protein IJL09_06630 [Lachnospiraceae bacterium]|nr:hypothetical protein [Lachnospiraceae bacterium]
MFGVRLDDSWMSEELEIKKLVFDHAECSVYIWPNRLSSTKLASNFVYLHGSTIKWYDEASHGMVTHPCSKDDLKVLYGILKNSDIGNWEFCTRKGVKVPPEVKQGLLKLIQEYVQG